MTFEPGQRVRIPHRSDLPGHVKIEMANPLGDGWTLSALKRSAWPRSPCGNGNPTWARAALGPARFSCSRGRGHHRDGCPVEEDLCSSGGMPGAVVGGGDGGVLGGVGEGASSPRTFPNLRSYYRNGSTKRWG